MTEHGLGMLENRLLRKRFWPKTDEGTEKRRRLQNEKLYNPYSSSNVIRVIKSKNVTGGTCSTF